MYRSAVGCGGAVHPRCTHPHPARFAEAAPSPCCDLCVVCGALCRRRYLCCVLCSISIRCVCIVAGAGAADHTQIAHHPSPYIISRNLLLILRSFNSGLLTCLNALQEPCHIHSERTHRLHAFLILNDLLRRVAVNLIPVL